ncbi:hypothetical protein I6E74_02080 [Salinibacterium sp. SWN139]|uniref:hypothetical protein n=1 Tax=Salinibacterium sp. SWN139 TaxID=2792055 RepID=UPI0018CEBE2B|nr:hypothetical protein [Salinibacterium sp. SWN139]MBH0052956.1 hypothetical protein [Salinibacterium sp. SWN139]
MTSAREKLRRLLSPWWAVAWFVAAIAWLTGLNILYIEGGGTNNWLGFISIVPIWSLTIYVVVRNARRRKSESGSHE